MNKKKRIIFLLLFTNFMMQGFAQDAKELQASAKNFMMQGDVSNAVLILNRALALEPNNMDIAKDLALDYYIQKDYPKALEIIKPTLDNAAADDQCFQIAGNIYQSLDQTKESEKVYKKGISNFPESGALYNDYGELLGENNSKEAIKQWEKGIEQAPEYSKNYFNACRYYYKKDKIWALLYGEIFLNIEPLNTHSPEIKAILLDSYKQLFADADLIKSNKEKNKFESSIVQIMNLQTNVATLGINAESLTMIRTRFILNWFQNKATDYPFQLFEFQRQLIREGLFDAYNQWLFGAAQNLTNYQSWITSHSIENQELIRFQKGRIFKMPQGQYYH